MTDKIVVKVEIFTRQKKPSSTIDERWQADKEDFEGEIMTCCKSLHGEKRF